MIDASAHNPRDATVSAVIGQEIHHRAIKLDAPLPELYAGFFAWNTRVCEAYGVRDTARFPMKTASIELLDRLEAEAAVHHRATVIRTGCLAPDR